MKIMIDGQERMMTKEEMKDWELTIKDAPNIVFLQQNISDLHFFYELHKRNHLTEKEVFDTCSVGKLPKLINDYLNTIDDKFKVKLYFSSTKAFDKDSEIVKSFLEYLKIDFNDFWISASETKF